jgi:GxxExxY protein
MRDSQSHPHMELTEKIIGAAMAVHRELAPGLDEKIYENSLCLEFASMGLDFTQQEHFPVHYRGRVVGRLITDLIVEQRVIVDTKVVESFTDTHIAQVLGYLSITGLQVGLLLNFKHASLKLKRVANVYLKSNP